MMRILCPVDLSEASAHAIEQAIALAAWTHARITALHVYQPIFMPVPGLPDLENRVPDAELQRVREETRACFRDAEGRGIGVDVLVEVGQPATHILDCAAGLRADVVVMGTHGAGGFEHLLLGSVAEKVLRKATCAVLTVPPRAHATSRLPFQRLLCAVDFSDASLAAARFACEMARETGASLTLLHVIEWPWPEPPPPAAGELPSQQAAALAEYRRYLESTAASRLAALVPDDASGLCAAVPLIGHGKSYVEILRVAAADRSDLIVIGVHGRSAVDVMLFGSTTSQVVRRAACPVMTLQPRSPDGAGV
jgi:nucleotide-binding universal stress UspA family protein